MDDGFCGICGGLIHGMGDEGGCTCEVPNSNPLFDDEDMIEDEGYY